MTLLSVVIPTKNRPDTAVAAVGTALAVPGDDVEIIVQDCSSEPGLGLRLTERYSDPRLRYEYDPSRRSMADNWSAALTRVRGEYVTFIGDDDAVLPEIRDAAAWARSKSLGAVTFPHDVFWWPGFPGPRAGQLLVGRHSGEVTMRNAPQELEAALATRNVFVIRLPQLYQGMLRTDVLPKRNTGRFVETLAPDYFSAITAACTLTHYGFVDYPYVLAGYSAQSNSGRHFTKGISQHFNEYSLDWPHMLPLLDDRSKVTDLIIAQSVIASLELNGRSDLLSQVPLTRYYASSLLSLPRDPSAWLQHYLRVQKTTRQLSTPRALIDLAYETLQVSKARLRSHLIDRVPSAILAQRGYCMTPADSLEAAVATERRMLDAVALKSPLA